MFRTAIAVSPHSSLVMNDRDALRRAARRRRAAAVAAQNDAGERLAAAFLSGIPFRAHQTASGYWPVGTEIDDRLILRGLMAEGLAAALPCVVKADQALAFRSWREADRLVPGPYGIPAPHDTAPVLRPTLVVVPLLLFDGAGHRLGSGMGFYDRTLAEIRAQSSILAVGVGFAAQRIAELPVLPTDQRLDAVVTEEGVEWF